MVLLSVVRPDPDHLLVTRVLCRLDPVGLLSLLCPYLTGVVTRSVVDRELSTKAVLIVLIIRNDCLV